MAFARNQLRLVVVGHVDHGKSTLIGRLFYDTGSLPEGKYEQLVAIAQRRGVPFEFANLMDALQAERDQNITIDTTQIWFRTPKREYVIIDAPGHKEFVKNMVTGAARADAALIIIDASEGVQEQTRRHGYLLRLIGVRQVVVVVNKMDLVDYSQRVFDNISSEYRQFLKGIGVEAQFILPVSARHGDNIAARGENLNWFSGPAVLEALDAIPDPKAVTNQPLRFPIQDVYRFDHRRILAGRLEAGTLRAGDQLLFLPSGRTASYVRLRAGTRRKSSRSKPAILPASRSPINCSSSGVPWPCTPTMRPAWPRNSPHAFSGSGARRWPPASATS